MLQAIAENFGHLFGPLRLFGSYLFLAGFVGAVCLIATFWVLPRYWHLLPGEVHVFAAKVKPGMHTVALQCFDWSGCLLPRYRQTRYCVPVRGGKTESIYLMHITPEVDNVYQPEK